MAFDAVPWAIGGGAEVSDETARLFANIATRDAQGVALPGDLKVTALGTPGGAVQIAPGGVVIRNVQAPGQSYVGRGGSTTQVAIAPTGSGAGRSDLIIARVRDPDFAPWQPYTDPVQIAAGPYFEPFVISGVSPTTQFASEVVSYSAEALARIDIPASTAAITDAMITPLRRLVSPRTWFAYDLVRATGTQNLSTSTVFAQWPSNSINVAVPTWATHAQVTAEFQSLVAIGLAYSEHRVVFGGSSGPAFTLDNDTTTQAGGGERVPMPITGEFDVRSVQGQTLVLKTEARRISAGQTSTLRADTRTLIQYDVRFSERVV